MGAISLCTGWPQRTRVFSWFRPWADRNENSLLRIARALVRRGDHFLVTRREATRIRPIIYPLVGHSAQLFLLSLDTLERKQIATGCDYALEPGLSPLGDSLVYLCIRDDGDFSLNLLELREGKNQRLFDGPQRIQGPTWTRDGARIIFSTSSPFTRFGGGELWQITPGRTESPEKVPVGHDVTHRS